MWLFFVRKIIGGLRSQALLTCGAGGAQEGVVKHVPYVVYVLFVMAGVCRFLWNNCFAVVCLSLLSIINLRKECFFVALWHHFVVCGFGGARESREERCSRELVAL